MKRTTDERFFEKVDFNGPIPAHCPELGACWIWTGVRSNSYGKFWNSGRTVLAHRFAWERVNGPIPVGSNVMHECDTPLCVRHLKMGTQSDNIRDAVAKGRRDAAHRLFTQRQAGATNTMAKLTELDVASIRTSNERTGLIATRFNVSRRAIQNIRAFRAWKKLA